MWCQKWVSALWWSKEDNSISQTIFGAYSLVNWSAKESFLIYLILNTNFCPECVFRGPLLCERQPILSPLVLGFQGSGDLASVYVGWAGCFKLLKWRGRQEEINSTWKQYSRLKKFIRSYYTFYIVHFCTPHSCCLLADIKQHHICDNLESPENTCNAQCIFIVTAKLTTPLVDFVFTSSLTSPKPARTMTVRDYFLSLVAHSKPSQSVLWEGIKYTLIKLSFILLPVTISLIEDVLRWFSEVCICWWNCHFACQKKDISESVNVHKGP